MAAVWVRARAELRRRWRATVLLAVLVGLAGGVVLAAVAGSRRTGSAMDRFLAYNRPLNVGVAGLDMAAVERLPHVADVDEGSLVPLVADTPSGPGNPPATGVIAAYATVHGRTGVTSERAIVVRGRRPDPGRPLEVAVNEPLAARRHLRPGDRLRAVAYSPRQFEGGVDSSAIGRPRGPALDLTVTGVVRRPGDLSPVPIQQDVIYLGADTMELSPAFWAAYHDSVANLGVFVGLRLHGGPAELDAFTAAVRALPGGHQAKIEIGSDAEAAAGKARRAMRVQAVALLVFAVLAALAGLLVVGQAIARQVQLDTGDMSVLRAVGMTRSQLVAATLVPAGLVGAGGALLAVALAVLASPLTPIGLAREAEIDPGLSADGTVLALGGLAVLLAVPARAAVAAWWATRAAGGRAGGQAPGRSSRVVDRVARAGATPSAVTGIRMALESGRGDTAAPARAAVVGAAVAVVAVTASLTFAASLGHLVGSPALQGWNWDVAVGNPNDEADITARGELLAGNADVAGYSAFEQPVERVKVQGTAVPVFGMSPVKGAVLPVVLHGREARTPDELSLGPGTLRQLRRGLGDVVQVEGATERRALRIVGEVLLPNLASSATMTTGALLTVEGVHALLPAARPPGQFVVEYAAGADHAAAYASLRRDFGPTVLRASPPNEVENLRRVSGLPVLLAALLAVLGAATLGHLLVTVIRRRRRDLGVLKTIGFVRGQVAATVAWQATTLALVALLVGLPLGLVAGRWAWLLVNQELGSLAGPVTPTVALLAAVPATVLVANLVAALPARSAAATRPAVVLRSE